VVVRGEVRSEHRPEARVDGERAPGRREQPGPDVAFVVLIVCTGNTCRSAMAQVLLERRLRGRRVSISSAGTNTVAGMPASEGAAQVMHEQGLDLSGHRSTPLTAALVRAADLILCMESRHRRRVLEFVPEAESRTFLVTNYCGGTGSEDVFDPVGSSLEVFREVAKIIAECLEKAAQDMEWRLSPEPGSR
jgi:protein-tyrosine-phosphatase